MSSTELLTKVKAADRTAAAELATYVKEKGCASLKVRSAPEVFCPQAVVQLL